MALKDYGDAKPVETQEDKEKKRSILLRRYLKRFDHVKVGQDHFNREEFPAAIENYREYLHILIDWHQVDIKQLTPKLFHPVKDIGELLVISHIFWDLARVYDRVPTLKNEFQQCIDQFVAFTINMSYQDINLRTMTKYIRTHGVRNRSAFERAHSKLVTKSKKCYIASYCMGGEHPSTQQLRELRNWMLGFRVGRRFVQFYYHYSPKFVALLEQRPRLGLCMNFLLTPYLKLLAKLWSLKK